MKRFNRLAIILAVILLISLPDMRSKAEDSVILPLANDQTEAVMLPMNDKAAYDEDLLEYALMDANSDESVLMLDIEKISGRYGVPVCIYAIVPPADYPERGKAVSEGEFTLDADGKERYLLIEDREKNALWAGVYGGYREDIPRALLYYDEIKVSEQTDGTDGHLILDLSEVAAQYGDITVYAATVGRKYTKIVIGEDEKYWIKASNVDKYIRISGKVKTPDGDTSEVYFWCGLISGCSEGEDKNIIFHVVDDPIPTAEETKELWDFEINRVDAASAALTFKNEISELLQQRLWIQYEFVDKDGEILKIALDDAPDISLIGSYNYSIDAVPEETVKVTVKLIYRGEKVAEEEFEYQTADETDNPDPIEAPVIELTQEQNNRQAEGVSFLGTVFVSDDSLPLDNWEFVINGEVCDPDECSEIDEGRYSFAFNEYPCEPECSELVIVLRHRTEKEIESEEQKLEILEPIVQLVVNDYVGIYDGQMHEIDVTSVDGIVFSHIKVEEDEADLSQAVWNEGLPQISDAGEWTFYIRAEKEGCIIEFVDAAGNIIETENGCVKAAIRIEPVLVRIKIWAEQMDKTIEYNDREQMIQAEYQIEVLEDVSGLFDISKITKHKQWKKSESISAEDAMVEYAVEPTEGQFDFIKDLDPNFNVLIEWQSSSIVINKKKLVLESASDCIVYGAQEKLVNGKLTNDQRIDGTKDIINYFSGDVTACGVQEGVGVSRNEIKISGTFGDKKQNYDITENTGVLVIFPQSINENDLMWKDVEDEIDEMQYVDKSADELPGFYYGMCVDLKTASNVYDGKAHEIQIRFRNSRGENINMIEGIDYEIKYFRLNKETQDLTSAGLITVQVSGIGNYTGNIELVYEIKAKQIANTEVSIDSWKYDGECAGSAAHPLYTDSEPTQYVYFDDSNMEMAVPPADAGKYTVQAVWDFDANYAITESDKFAFEIYPVVVMITVQNGEVIQLVDDSGLFDEEMLVYDGKEYTSSNKNFMIEVKSLDDEESSDHNESVSVTIENWIYDGSAANSQEHSIVVQGTTEECSYRFYDEQGRQIDAPSEAGIYRVVASWGVPERTAETIFTIKPLVVTLKADDITKIYGAEDPELTVTMSKQIDNIDFEIVRQSGENAGEYVIDIRGASVQGSYELIFETGSFIIQPKAIDSAEVTFNENDEVTVWDGDELQQDVDYIVVSDGHEKNQVDIQGIGNYTGTISHVISGEEREPQGFSFKRMMDNKLLWVVITVVMLLGSIICSVYWHKFNQRLKIERLRLLDTVSRQSNRTIQENHEQD